VLAAYGNNRGGLTVREAPLAATRMAAWAPPADRRHGGMALAGAAALARRARKRAHAWAAACMRARPRKLLPASQEPVLHVHVYAGARAPGQSTVEARP